MSEKRRPWDDVDTLTADYVDRRIQAAQERLPDDLRPTLAALKATIFDRKRIEKVWRLSGVPEAKKNDFTEAMGLPFVSFRRELRLDAAKMLVECTSLTVEKISERVGYRAHATLTNAFTEHFGLSPSAYRLLMSEAAAEWERGHTTFIVQPQNFTRTATLIERATGLFWLVTVTGKRGHIYRTR